MDRAKGFVGAGVRKTRLSAWLMRLGSVAFLVLFCAGFAQGQEQSKAAKDSAGVGRVPQLVDITASTGIHFEHLSSPEQK